MSDGTRFPSDPRDAIPQLIASTPRDHKVTIELARALLDTADSTSPWTEKLLYLRAISTLESRVLAVEARDSQ